MYTTECGPRDTIFRQRVFTLSAQPPNFSFTMELYRFPLVVLHAEKMPSNSGVMPIRPFPRRHRSFFFEAGCCALGTVRSGLRLAWTLRTTSTPSKIPFANVVRTDTVHLLPDRTPLKLPAHRVRRMHPPLKPLPEDSSQKTLFLSTEISLSLSRAIVPHQQAVPLSASEPRLVYVTCLLSHLLP